MQPAGGLLGLPVAPGEQHQTVKNSRRPSSIMLESTHLVAGCIHE